MSVIGLGGPCLVFVVVATAACSGVGATRPHDAAPQSGSPQEEAVERAFALRQEASTLRDMAERREVEANLLSQRPNPDQAVITRKRRLARDLKAEADDLEQRALEAEKAIPHGMVPQ